MGFGEAGLPKALPVLEEPKKLYHNHRPHLTQLMPVEYNYSLLCDFCSESAH